LAFWGDYHTHTTYSHGRGTVEENVQRAIELGLKEIAITDHGFKHMTYNVRRMDWPYLEKEVKALREKYPEIKILLGLETNFNSADGNIDVLPSEIEKLDIVVCGYHAFCKPDKLGDIFKFWLPNLMLKLTRRKSPKWKLKNTNTYIKAIEKNTIDIVSHPNYDMIIDVVEVAKACKHFGTYLELNGRKIQISDEELEKVAATGVEFVCNSDAHHVGDVGEISKAIETIKRVGIPYSQIANWERFPILRSQKLKKVLYKSDAQLIEEK